MNELYKLPKGYSVKTGSKLGSGFWYCAKLTAKTTEDIELIAKQYQIRETVTLKRLENQLANLDKFYQDKINQWMNNPKNKKKKQELKDAYLAKMEKEKEAKRQQLPITISHLKFDIETPLFSRKVVEIREGISPDEPKTKVVYVEGYERGAYWTLKEYARTQLPKEQQKSFNVRLPRLSESGNW